MKLLILIGITVCGLIGGWLGALADGGNWFGMWSILGSIVGSFVGIWVGVKASQYIDL